MEQNSEKLIDIGEPFIIRDAQDILKPKLAVARYLGDLYEDKVTGATGRQIMLRMINRPFDEFVLSTTRRLGIGVYTNRDNRFLFLQLRFLNFEDISQFFDGFKGIPQRVVRESQELFDSLHEKNP